MKRTFENTGLFFLLLTFCGSAVTSAEDLSVPDGSTLTISANETRELTTETYDNLGTLKIETDGTLKIGSAVANGTPVEGLSGLNLGVVQSFGTIDGEQILHFQEGSQIEGIVRSTKNIVFNGSSTIDATIEAKALVFNNLEDAADPEPSVLRLLDGSELSIDTLVVHGSLDIEDTGMTITLDADLVLGTSGAMLVVTEDLVVTGNYAAVSGTAVKSAKENWTVTFQGGGEKDENGYNNVISQAGIAGNVRMENSTNIAENLIVQGDLTLGENSNTFAEKGLLVYGLFTLEENASLEMIGDLNAMVVFSPGTYNGILTGGFELKEGASLTASQEDHHLQLAVGADSSLAAGSTMSATLIQLVGTDSSGSYKVREIENLGNIIATGQLNLVAATLVNADDGRIEINSLQMTNSSTLDLTGSNDDDGGLTFTGTDGTVSIGVNSVIEAEAKTVHFGSAAVTNHNSAGGISAKEIRFGDGGSYQVGINSSGDGAGVVLAHAVFERGSTLILDSTGHVSFDKYNVLLETGSIIEMRIDSGTVGTLYTTGTIETQENVVLAIADGSNFEGRTQTFLVAQGDTDSVFHEHLIFEDSLFFELSDHWTQDLEDSSGNLYKGLCIEVVKVADLVDYAGSANQQSLAKMVDQMIADQSATAQQAELYDALMRLADDATYRQGLDSLSGSVRENAVAFAMSAPWRRAMDNIGFHRLSLALVKKQTAAREEENLDEITIGQSKSILPKAPMSRNGLGFDLWFDSYYHYNKLDSDSNTTGGNGQRGGVVVGAGLPTLSREALLGLTFGFSDGQFKQRSDRVYIDDYQFGIYAGTNLLNRNLQIRGYVGYGVQDYGMKRNVQIGSLSMRQARAETDGTSISAALMLIRPVDMSRRWLLKPTLGIDFERVEQDGFVETGSGGIIWGYDDVSLSRTMMRFGVNSEYQYRRAEWTGRLFYGVKLAGDNAASSRHYNPSLPSYGFDVSSVNIGTGVFDIGLGGNVGLNASRTSLFFFDYNGSFTGHGDAHTGSMGVLFKR